MLPCFITAYVYDNIKVEFLIYKVPSTLASKGGVGCYLEDPGWKSLVQGPSESELPAMSAMASVAHAVASTGEEPV